MEFLTLDLYAILGDVSCKIQTGFLKKYGYHMALPALLFTIGVVYAMARAEESIAVPQKLHN